MFLDEEEEAKHNSGGLDVSGAGVFVCSCLCVEVRRCLVLVITACVVGREARGGAAGVALTQC